MLTFTYLFKFKAKIRFYAVKSMIILLIAFGLIAINLCLFWKINEVVPNAYMDEIFHIPQAQAYCDGNFTQVFLHFYFSICYFWHLLINKKWNDKITTLPGLYLFSAVPIRFISKITDIDSKTWCTTYSLRLINFLLIGPTFWILFKIYNQIHNENKKMNLKVIFWNQYFQ